jgi:hypothetical protein
MVILRTVTIFAFLRTLTPALSTLLRAGLSRRERGIKAAIRARVEYIIVLRH